MALVAAGCGGGEDPPPGPPPDVGWRAFGGTADGARFSPLRQIDRTTVGRLRVAWRRDQDPRLALWETYPVVVGDTMYLTSNTGEVTAVDATTGALRWRHVPTVDFLAPGGGAEAAPVNRGVAVGDGRVYLLTYDARLVALDAATGAERWSTPAAEPGKGYAGTSPPTFSRGVLYLGTAGSDAGGSRGFVAAFDAATGRRRWRTWTVPPAGRGGLPPGAGGGRVWMPPTVDARTNTVYAGTGNPSPALTRAPRRGCIPWASGLVALDAATGRVRWGVSEVCGDVWDYDGGQPPLLYDAGGRRIVAHANKSGLYALRDAATGRPVAAPRALLDRVRPRPTRRGVRVCPGALGGVPYSPAAYSPASRTLFQPLVRMCMVYRLGTAIRGGPRVQLGGGTAVPDPRGEARGELVALDAGAGRVRWRRRTAAPLVGGALATAGGLVFSGSDDGRLYAFDARTGAVVWRHVVGLAFGSAPLTYRVRGVQYLAVVAGGSSLATLTGARVGGRLVVLRLPPDAVRTR